MHFLQALPYGDRHQWPGEIVRSAQSLRENLPVSVKTGGVSLPSEVVNDLAGIERKPERRSIGPKDFEGIMQVLHWSHGWAAGREPSITDDVLVQSEIAAFFP